MRKKAIQSAIQAGQPPPAKKKKSIPPHVRTRMLRETTVMEPTIYSTESPPESSPPESIFSAESYPESIEPSTSTSDAESVPEPTEKGKSKLLEFK